MASKYDELLKIATGQKTLRTRFEMQAVNKTTELVNELVSFMGMPRDRIALLELEHKREEYCAPGGTVITSSGLKFGFRVMVDAVYVNFVSTISPAGDRLLVAINETETIDVTEREGVLRWCEWMEGYVRDGLSETVNGTLSAMLLAPKG